MPTPQIFIPFVATPKSQVNVTTITFATTDYYMYRMQGSGAQNDEMQFDFASDAGTYTFALFHRAGNIVGIYTVQIDGSTVGTIDGFTSTSTTKISTITGIVLTAGVHTLRLAMLTKNGSSSSYFFNAAAGHFLQTA